MKVKGHWSLPFVFIERSKSIVTKHCIPIYASHMSDERLMKRRYETKVNSVNDGPIF